MLKTVEGFVLTETPSGESSKILNILTKDMGLIGVIAKGCKRVKSPLRLKAAKFTYGLFHINYFENKLSTLIDIDLLTDLNYLRKDIVTLSYISYISELTHQVVRDSYTSSMYPLFISAFNKIINGMDPMIITNILEVKYLEYIGVGLNLDCCYKCGSKTSIVTIDPDEGGLVCSNCYTNQYIFNPKIIKLLRMYYYVDISKISKLDISKEIVTEINLFLDKYYERFTGLYLNSKKFLNSLVNN